jgi:uncharacterized protein (TIGR03067 family)
VKTLLPLTVLAFAPVAADKPAPKRPDKERIQGTWVVVAWEEDGEENKRKVEERKKHKYTIKGASITESTLLGHVGKIKLDPDKKPAALDVEATIFEQKVNYYFVYEFVDDDTLRICSKPYGLERPKELTSKGGQYVFTLKRERKRPEK